MKDITMNGKEQQRAMILTGVIEGRRLLKKSGGILVLTNSRGAAR